MSKTTTENLNIRLRLRNKDMKQKFNEIKNSVGLATNTDVLRFLITEHHKEKIAKNSHQPALFYPQEAQALLSSLQRIKKHVNRQQPPGKGWRSKVNEELDSWIRRIGFILRERR